MTPIPWNPNGVPWPIRTVADAVEQGLRTGRCGKWTVEHRGDWPMPDGAPTTPPDDEGKP